jgi:hypothetical protein
MIKIESECPECYEVSTTEYTDPENLKSGALIAKCEDQDCGIYYAVVFKINTTVWGDSFKLTTPDAEHSQVVIGPYNAEFADET